MPEDKRERIQIRISREERLKAKIKLAQANIRWQDLLYPALARWINEGTLEIDTPRPAAAAEGLSARDAELIQQCARALRENAGTQEMRTALRSMLAAFSAIPPSKKR